MLSVRAQIGRPIDSVRIVIQDYGTTDQSKWKVTNIPLDKVIFISNEAISRIKKWYRWLVRRVKGMLGIASILAVTAIADHYGVKHNIPAHQMPMVVSAITSAVCTSFKGELGVGTHNFTVTTGDVVKTALYTSSATLGASTTAYSATNETTGTGYTATGVTMANVTPTTSGTTAIFDWADAVWTTATFTANGSLSYNSSKSNKGIFVIAFGSDQTVTAGTFTIQWPTADASNAILRI